MRGVFTGRQLDQSKGAAPSTSPSGSLRRGEPRVLIIDAAELDAVAIQLALRERRITAGILPGFARALLRVRRIPDALDLLICVGTGDASLDFLREVARLRRDTRFVVLSTPAEEIGRAHAQLLERLGRASALLGPTTAAKEIADASVAILETPARRSRPTLVLVDGNPSQRRQNERVLRRLGYEVIGLSTSDQALELAQRRQVRIDAVLVASRPGLRSGEEIIQDVRSLRPDMPGLILRDHGDARRLEACGVPVLERPRTPEDLEGAVARLLVLNAGAASLHGVSRTTQSLGDH
ncbi:MAG: hypothetical protein JRG86_22810 [Deltaproteobacteria bacterium]|jgi:ActR/RegA family two-component response regulator|nr:hypothetical protein [Deltaproteobacteria bacterium]MBW2501147.1 hypothetical protein [Deltaproteobacteria bacterium]